MRDDSAEPLESHDVPRGSAADEPASWRSGRGSIVARSIGGRTVLATARAETPLRLVRPTFPGTTAAAVCLVTFGGGLVNGDEVELDVTVEAGATLIVFTQSSTKVFRGAARQALRAKVEGTLVLLPDPVAAFASARFTQRIDIELTADGACVSMDGFTSGRAAFGERWAMSALDLRTNVSHDGRAIVSDALNLNASDGAIVARCGNFDAFATLIAVGRRAEPIVRSILGDALALPSNELLVATSTLTRAEEAGLPGAIARIAASSPAVALSAVRSRLQKLHEIDAVDTFAARF
ncbi:MAG TPA: urease accessory protein UreD [Labilithrix sp.]|nr:urease accessory protein UreD [Labilithrix sp.]